MRIVEDSDKEVFSARCPDCWSLLYFSRTDVRAPNSLVETRGGVGSCNVPFVVCPKCGGIASDIYDLDGIRKVSG